MRAVADCAKRRAAAKVLYWADPEKYRKKARKWRIPRRKKYNQKSLEWNRANKERCRDNMKKWRLRNKAHVQAYDRERMKNPQNRIRRQLCVRLHEVLNYAGTRKSYRTLSFIGCDYLFLMRWIEGKFAAGMSWDNYGQFGWHIDHVRPCASFDLLDLVQQKECFHYTNLQPLWWRENIQKGCKIIK